jgi:hypothetical protein
MAARLAVGAKVAGVLLTIHLVATPALWKHPVPPWAERTWQSWRVEAWDWADASVAPALRSVGVPGTATGLTGSAVAAAVELVTSVPYDVAAPALGSAWIGMVVAFLLGGRGRPR